MGLLLFPFQLLELARQFPELGQIAFRPVPDLQDKDDPVRQKRRGRPFAEGRERSVPATRSKGPTWRSLISVTVPGRSAWPRAKRA